jgi:ABC-type lipoprotein export system ATPase subunit
MMSRTNGTGSYVVQATDVRKEYGRQASLVRAVDGVSLEVAHGETVAIMGPSGCGKSTLLYLLGGLDRPTAGQIWVADEDLSGLSERALARMRRQAIGFVFQAFHLMDELSAVENIELPALLAGRSPRSARRRARELLEQVGLADRAGHLPSQMSGGQRQRVAVARALVADPVVVLADEPTGNLDSAATREVMDLFGRLHRAGQTLIIVTHDVQVAATADRMISMRDGRLIDQTLPRRDTSGRREVLTRLEG